VGTDQEQEGRLGGGPLRRVQALSVVQIGRDGADEEVFTDDSRRTKSIRRRASLPAPSGLPAAGGCPLCYYHALRHVR